VSPSGRGRGHVTCLNFGEKRFFFVFVARTHGPSASAQLSVLQIGTGFLVFLLLQLTHKIQVTAMSEFHRKLKKEKFCRIAI